MQIVIDSNVMFSAVVRDSVTRKLIIDYNGLFLLPEFVFDEMKGHKDELLGKSGLSEGDLDVMMGFLLSKTEIIPTSFLLSYMDEAVKAVKDIDPKDAIFVACCLAHPNSVLWSDDKALKRQNKVSVLSTREIMEII